MNKIKIILSLMLFFTPSVCFAKIIKIDRVKFSVDDTLALKGLIYDSKTNSLTLTDATYESIESEFDLNITLIGNNTINNTKTSNCLKGQNVILNGNGTLNLISSSNGINANSLEINNATIYADIENKLIEIEGENSKLEINNSNIIFNSNNIGFDINNKDININESNIIAKKTYSIMGENSNNLSLNNSSLIIIESDILGINSNKILIDDNSKVFIYSKNGIDENYLLSNQKYLGSIDNITYHDSINKDDKYLKINIDNTKDLLDLEKEKEELEKEKENIYLKEEELKELEESLNQEQENLKNKEGELKEINNNLNKKEEELMEKELYLEDKDNDIKERSISIDGLSSILTGSFLENEITKKNLEQEREEIDSLKRYIAFKEQELKNREKKLFLEYDSNPEENLEVAEDKIDYKKDNKEVLEDDLLNNNYLDTKTHTNYLDKVVNIFSLLVSYIGGIITHIFTKRRLNG